MGSHWPGRGARRKGKLGRGVLADAKEKCFGFETYERSDTGWWKSVVDMWWVLPGEAHNTQCVVCDGGAPYCDASCRASFVCTHHFGHISVWFSQLTLCETRPRWRKGYRGGRIHFQWPRGPRCLKVCMNGREGAPTLPPLSWRVQPAVCVQSQKNKNTCAQHSCCHPPRQPCLC